MIDNEKTESVESNVVDNNETTVENENNVEINVETENVENTETVETNEPSELELLKQENERLRQELLNKEMNGLSQEQIDDINNSNFNSEGKSFLAQMLKKYGSSTNPTTQVENQASIANETNDYDSQFDENGDVKLKDLNELL